MFLSKSERDFVISDPHAKLGFRHLRDPLVFVATGAGCGLSPVAPGTVGSLLGVVVWWFVFADLDLYTRTAAAFAAFAGGAFLIERLLARNPLGDAPAIVLDEIVGVWFALLAAPKSLAWVAAGFVLFRIADIAKPWPVSWADRSVKGGLGIMLDDWIAGLAVATVLVVARLVLG